MLTRITPELPSDDVRAAVAHYQLTFGQPLW